VFVNQTVVNVALPALREDLGASLADQQWVVESYFLLLASLLLVGGSLGDLYGRRRIVAIGVGGFRRGIADLRGGAVGGAADRRAAQVAARQRRSGRLGDRRPCAAPASHARGACGRGGLR